MDNTENHQLLGKFESEKEEAEFLEQTEKAVEEARKKLQEEKNGTESNKPPVVHQLLTRVETNDVNNRKFLILIVGFYKDNLDKEYRDWVIARGRRGAYDAIMNYMDDDSDIEVDLIESKIIAETEKLDTAKSLYKYMSYIIDNELIELAPGEFYPDLESYIDGDIEEYEFNEDGLPDVEGGM